MTEKPNEPTDSSSNEEKALHKSWEKSNRLSLMLMQMTVSNNIKTTIPETLNAKEFMKSVKDISQSESADKSSAGTLMSNLTTMKFDGPRTMHEHVTEMSNIASRLKTMGMTVDESFLVQFIINSLPPQYGPFQINYNTMKDKWNATELHSMLIQEEARLKKQGVHSINLVGHSRVKSKPGMKNGKGNKGPLNINESSAHIHKKEWKVNKCHFCKKPGHYQKDCHKREAWFERKGIHYDPNHKPK